MEPRERAGFFFWPDFALRIPTQEKGHQQEGKTKIFDLMLIDIRNRFAQNLLCLRGLLRR